MTPRLGDARGGKLADNITGFGRTLRRAGVPLDASRLALALQAAQWVDLGRRDDLCAALETVLVSREADRAVFRELFDAYFRDPDIARQLLAQMLPTAQGRAEPSRRRPRVNEALSPPKAAGQAGPPKAPDDKIELDAAMTASEAERLRNRECRAEAGALADSSG